jgi:hypothetical protein
MASKFKAGMMNLVEVLNQMWDAFSAGPYNALPLTGVTPMTGPLVVNNTVTASGLVQSGTKLTAPVLQIGPFVSSTLSTVGAAVQTQGVEEFVVINSARFFVGSGPGGSGAACALNVGSNTVTGRGITSGGSITGGGADYAEYLIKGLLCGTIAPGQIVGIDGDGRLTDNWDLAISFAVKSTNPCMVGGDTWAAHLGLRPADPVREEDVTEDQWAEALAVGKAAQREFDVALETARQTVDRIAFAGQVPVNLQDATPGQYIVPVKVGDGIAGLAIDEVDVTLHQYMRAIGRVIAIEDDGRARIIVKVA